MSHIKVINKTEWNLDFLKEYAAKLEPYLDLAVPQKYPFKVTVVKKRNFYDRSSFDLDSSELTLKIDMKKQSKEDIAWVLVHEFAHFLSTNNKELFKTCLSEEQKSLEKILQKTYGIDIEKVHEIFHDFLPGEVAANFFATMIIGTFHKRHPFSNVKIFLKGKEDGHEKT